MQVRIIQRSGNREHKDLIELVAKQLVDWLPSNNATSLLITMAGRKPMESMRGGTIIDPETGTKDLKNFSIQIKGFDDIEDQITALCHEMVHVKQIIDGTLEYHWNDEKSNWRFIWKGEDLTHLNYNQRPWEIEAEDLERTLATKLQSSVKVADFAEENWHKYYTGESSFLDIDFLTVV